MSRSKTWQAELERQLSSRVVKFSILSGGDFAESYLALLDNGEQLFVKTHYEPLPDFFTTEAQGLSWLRDSNTVNVPRVLALCDNPPLLALQWIEQSSRSSADEAAFGQQLAAMHSVSNSYFGRPDERKTGSQGLPNKQFSTWAEAYAQNRLLPLAKLAHDKRALPERSVRKLNDVAQSLEQLDVPTEPPALLHGDLWAGNRVVDQSGRSWLIDPAAQFGHREFDLAMMRLFGGFSERCFDAYQAVAPLAQGYQKRVHLHQLAPLVVHAIKFGGHYVQATANALDKTI